LEGFLYLFVAFVDNVKLYFNSLRECLVNSLCT